MRLLRINKNLIDFSLEETDTIESVVKRIIHWSKELHEYPVKIVIDAQEYTINNHEWRTHALKDIDTIDVHTFSPHTMRDFLPQIDSIPHLLQDNKKAEAMKIIFNLSTLISHLILIIPLLEKTNHEDTKSQIIKLTEDLRNLHQSIIDDDIVLIGDLIEYEICVKLDALLHTIGA